MRTKGKFLGGNKLLKPPKCKTSKYSRAVKVYLHSLFGQRALVYKLIVYRITSEC